MYPFVGLLVRTAVENNNHWFEAVFPLDGVVGIHVSELTAQVLVFGVAEDDQSETYRRIQRRFSTWIEVQSECMNKN